MLPIYIALLYYWLITRLIPGLYRQWKCSKLVKLKRRVIVFTRYPTPGKTKTRLMSFLGAFGAAGLQLLMTDHLLNVLSKCSSKLHSICIEVRYYGGSNAQMDYWLDRRVPMSIHRPQVGEDLGARMANAIDVAFTEGVQTVIVVGSDIPGISTRIIRNTFNQLENNSKTDLVIGPAEDGGYYAIGLSIRVHNKIGKLFEGIDWGTERVFQQQMTTAEKLGITQTMVLTKLNDVDTEVDLPHVEKHVNITKSDILQPYWSIVIPILNESKSLESSIRHLVKNADSPERLEIIIVDGRSNDNPTEIIERLKIELQSVGTKLMIVSSQRGRGTQLITGAEASKHKLLLFLHIDSQVPRHYDTMAWHTLFKPGVIAGAFQFGLDVVHEEEKKKQVSWWFLQEMRLLEWGTRRRVAKMELPYGDQGLFMWRRTYDLVGGYPDYRLMEDYEMISRLKVYGHIATVSGPPIITSCRRWQKHGYLKITSMNTLIILAYKCGVSPDTLARWYYEQ